MPTKNQRIFITGDAHGDFAFLSNFCSNHKTSKNDILIILGDAGFNYYVTPFNNPNNPTVKYKNTINSRVIKSNVNELPITLFCIHGNHEARPETVEGYCQRIFNGGLVYAENEYPNILFASDCECFKFNKKNVVVIGGAYSVDKYYRLKNRLNWFEDEQPTEAIKERLMDVCEKMDWNADIVLSHTTPFKYVPREMFLAQINQDSVDTTTEKFLDEIEDRLDYKKWYCGHYHTNKKIDKVHMLFHDVEMI